MIEKLIYLIIAVVFISLGISFLFMAISAKKDTERFIEGQKGRKTA